MGFLAPPGGSTLHNSRKHHFLAGTRVVAPLPLTVWQGWGVLPKLLLLPVHFVPRMEPMFKPLPGQCACFLKNLVPPVTAWVLFYFLLPDLWQGAYWKFLSTQMSSSHNSILEESHFVFLRKHLACLIVLSTWKETVWRRTVKNVKMRFRLLTRVPSRLY